MSKNRLICDTAMKLDNYIEDNYVDCLCSSPPYWDTRDNNSSEQIGNELTVRKYMDNLYTIFEIIKRKMKDTSTLFINISDKYPRNTKSAAGIPERFFLMMLDDLKFNARNKVIWDKFNSQPRVAPDRFSIYGWEPVYFFSKTQKYYFYRIFVPYSEQSKGNLGKDYTGIAQKDYKSSGAPDPSENKRSIQKSMRKNPGACLREVWRISQRRNAFHTSAFCKELVRICLVSGCPPYICSKCNKPAFPIFEPSEEYAKHLGKSWTPEQDKDRTKRSEFGFNKTSGKTVAITSEYFHTGWKKCSCQAPFSPGVVLDPFAGSCTTGVVAKEMGLNFIMFDTNKEYCRKSLERLKATKRDYSFPGVTLE